MKPPRKARIEADLLEYAAAYATNERHIAGRSGLPVGAVRCLLALAVVRAHRLVVRPADVVAAATAGPAATRRHLRLLLQRGYLERTGGPVAGRLAPAFAGRQLLAEFMRGWERGRNQLRELRPCAPFRRTTPRKPTPPTPGA